MIKLFTGVRKVLSMGKWVLLFVDTMQYFHDEAKNRGLTGEITTNENVS